MLILNNPTPTMSYSETLPQGWYTFYLLGTDLTAPTIFIFEAKR
jgi:hypothetical protein